MNTFATAVLSITLSVAAQLALKAGMSSVEIKELMSQPFSLRSSFKVFSNYYVLGGFLLYGMGAVVWLEVLSRWDVSKAYPLVGLGFVFTVLIGFLVGEQVGLPRMIGVALICGGVFLVGRS